MQNHRSSVYESGARAYSCLGCVGTRCQARRLRLCWEEGAAFSTSRKGGAVWVRLCMPCAWGQRAVTSWGSRSQVESRSSTD